MPVVRTADEQAILLAIATLTSGGPCKEGQAPHTSPNELDMAAGKIWGLQECLRCRQRSLGPMRDTEGKPMQCMELLNARMNLASEPTAPFHRDLGGCSSSYVGVCSGADEVDESVD